MRAVWSAPTAGLLRDAKLFDIYRPKAGQGTDAVPAQMAEKSMAVRLTLNSDDSTLTEAQIENSVQAVIDALTHSVNARQRA
jgi:phenylalanyl-tRNA synthetase beta chain